MPVRHRTRQPSVSLLAAGTGTPPFISSNPRWSIRTLANSGSMTASMLRCWLARDGWRCKRGRSSSHVRYITELPPGFRKTWASPSSVPVVVDYLSEVFAKAERNREIRAAVADAMPFTSTPEAYRRALLAATSPLRDCGALFVAQYSMHPYLADIRAAWRGGPIVSAVAATVDELRA